MNPTSRLSAIGLTAVMAAHLVAVGCAAETGNDGATGIGGSGAGVGGSVGGSAAGSGVGGSLTAGAGGSIATGMGGSDVGGATGVGGGGSAGIGGTAGIGGSSAGTAGSVTAGTSGAGGTSGELSMCSGISNEAACPVEGTCSNLSCGLADLGTRTCTCSGGFWDCSSCAFPTEGAPEVILPPTDPLPLCTIEADKAECATTGGMLGDRCLYDAPEGEACACWLTDSNDVPIWDCDSVPRTWEE